jgi:hypothetical protein
LCIYTYYAIKFRLNFKRENRNTEKEEIKLGGGEERTTTFRMKSERERKMMSLFGNKYIFLRHDDIKHTHTLIQAQVNTFVNAEVFPEKSVKGKARDNASRPFVIRLWVFSG